MRRSVRRFLLLLPVWLTLLYNAAHWAFERLDGVTLLRPLVDGDAWRHPEERARILGYRSETHLVTTDDGVVLELHRVRSAADADTAGGGGGGGGVKIPVVVQHGVMSSSAGWMANLANQSLAFILADAGYDVWLANSRGNVFSRRSAANRSDFWEHTKDDLLLDLPAVIDYALATSGSEFVHYVGHSQGGFLLFALLSERPEYADKIRLGVALAPVLKLTHTSPLINKQFRYIGQLYHWLSPRLMHSLEQFPSNVIFNPLMCRLLPGVCSSLLDALGGAHPSQSNATRVAVYASMLPAGTSLANYYHYTQSIYHGRFAKFDYGPQENMRRYGQQQPPDYPLAKVRGRVSIFYSEGDTDIFAGAGHNRWLLDSLPKETVVHHEAIPGIGHMDFQMGINAKSLAYDKMIQLMRANEN